MWTFKEVKFLKENYKRMSVLEISKKLNRSENSIRNKALRLGLSRKRGLYRAYKDGEVVAIGTSKELAERFNVDKRTIYDYATPRHYKRGVRLKIERIGMAE